MVHPALSRRASVRLPWARFQLPPRQTQHADFRHWAFLLPSSQGLCGRSCRECFRQVDDSVLGEQTEAVIKPTPTPPLPAEPRSFPLLHQVPPYLLLDPVLHVTEAAARLSDAEVVCPSAQDWVDEVNDSLSRLRAVAPKHCLELTHEFDACLYSRHTSRPPLAPPRLTAADVKSEEAKALALGEIDATRLVTIEFHVEFGQFFQKPLVSGLLKPLPSAVALLPERKR